MAAAAAKDLFRVTRADVAGWCDAKADAWLKRHQNVNAYYYRFADPGVAQRTGGWSPHEDALFHARIKEMADAGYELQTAWGIFSRAIPGRVGYQCSNRYRALVKRGVLADQAATKADGPAAAKRRRIASDALTEAVWSKPEVKELEARIDAWVREIMAERAATQRQEQLMDPTTPPNSIKRPRQEPVDDGSDDDFETPQRLAPAPAARAVPRVPPAARVAVAPPLPLEVKAALPLAAVASKPDDDGRPATAAAPARPGDASRRTLFSFFKPAEAKEAKAEAPVGDPAAPAAASCHKTAAAVVESVISLCSARDDEYLEVSPTSKAPAILKAKAGPADLVRVALQPIQSQRLHAQPPPPPPLSQAPVARRPARTISATAAFLGDGGDDFVARGPMRQHDLGRFWKGVPPPVRDTPEASDATVVRVPADPLPLTWAHVVQPRPLLDVTAERSRYIEDARIVAGDLRARHGLASDHYEGVLADPPWGDLGVEAVLAFLSALLTETFQPHGMLFLWVPKEALAHIVTAMGAIGYQYVENLIWVCKEVNNRLRGVPPAAGSGPITLATKQTLLFFRRFRRGSELELRHQRTADVVIDFVKPRATWTQAPGVERKPDRVYETIETLLPNATWCPEKRQGRLLELWARRGGARANWTAIHEA